MSVTVRDATADDYHGVMAIDPNHSIYHGNDYLPAEYHKFLNDPDRILSVCLVDNKIVAFNMFSYVDGGQTMIGQSGRTYREGPRTGVWSVFKEHLNTKMNDDKKVKRMSGVTSTYWHGLKQMSQPGWDPVHIIKIRYRSRAVFDPALVLNATSIPQLTPNRTRIMTKQQTTEQLKKPDTIWRLFPSRRVMCGIAEAVYRIMEENLSKIFANTVSVTGTFNLENECQSISFAHGYEVSDGYEYIINYYGIPSSDLTDVMDHVTVHLPMAAKLASGRPRLKFTIMTPFIMNNMKLEDCCKGLPGFQAMSKVNRTFALVFEHHKLDRHYAKL